MTLWFDIPKLLDDEPKQGDYLVTRCKTGRIGSAYLILKARGVRRRRMDADFRRYTLEVQKQVPTAEFIHEANWWMRWSPRPRSTERPNFLGFRRIR